MKLKRLVTLTLLITLALTLAPVSVIQAKPASNSTQQEVGANLLTNPGFEGIGRPNNNSTPNYGNWTRDTFNGAQYGEIFTPEGWVTWWQEGDYKRPECKVIPNEPPFTSDPKRINEGYYSGMCFTFFGKQNAGYYQVVRNIPPGSQVEGSFYAHAWACGDDAHQARSCAEPYSFYFQVGIDPNGGTDPFSSSIVWSNPTYNYDTYGLVGPVQATVGEAGVATFFMRAYAKWQLKHNDAYWDSASMILQAAGDPPTATPPPPPPTSAIPPTPQFTPTPRPDGAIVHTVVAGDSLFGLAITYGVDVDELRRLNAGTLGPNDMIVVGQEIIISVSPDAIQPTATPQPVAQETPSDAQPTTETQPEGGTPAPQGNTASICVLAFNDRSNDMFRQADSEELLPNAQMNIVGTGGPAGNYTTDGISEPYCFQNLQPGNYVLRHTPPPGYKLTDAGQWNIVLGAGQVSSLDLAYVRDESAGPNPDATGETPDQDNTDDNTESDEGESGGVTRVLNTIIRVSGIIVLVLAIAVGVLFFLSRRTA